MHSNASLEDLIREIILTSQLISNKGLLNFEKNS